MKNTNSRFRKLSAGIALGLMIFGAAAPTTTHAAPPGAAFTTVNEAVDGTGHCANGNPNVNCNIYDGKQYVWMSGGPLQAAVGNGSYFFAVLEPGAQNDPNDGAAGVLSDLSPTTNTGAGDAYTNRTFSISGGTITYAGSHGFANNKIRLMPYDDTTNPGGVYILAICSLANGYPVSATDCKYDAFKVGGTPPVDLTVSKDAHATLDRTFHWSITKDADKTTVTQAGGNVTFNYTVVAQHDAGTDSNVVVTGNIVVSNPNSFAVDVNVSDSVNDPNATCLVNGSATLAVQVPGNGSLTLPYTCSYSATPTSLNETNTVLITWQGFGTGSATFQFPFSFAINKIDECATVTDTVGGALGTVCDGDANPTSFTYSSVRPGVAGTCTNYDNTATFTTNDTSTTGSASKTVTVCVPLNLAVSKTASPAFKRTFKWGITKDADKTSVTQAGGNVSFNYTVAVQHDVGTDSDWTVTGKITINNPNDFSDFTGVNVSDVVDNGGICTVSGGTNVTVPKSGSVMLDYTCTYAAAPSANAGINTATAAWDQATFNTPASSASGSASFVFGAGPTPPNPSLIDNCVNVTDTVGGTLGTVCDGDANPKSFTYSSVRPGVAGTCTNYDNTATFTTNTTSATGSASKTVTVCVPLDLTVSKTANPAFKRTYKWSITKSVDKTLVKQVGGSATFNYTVNVVKDGGTDSNWVVSGNILVSNPNDFFDLSGVNVSDAVNNGGTCTVTGGANVTVPKSASVSLPYTCTYAAAPSANAGTNTATAAWDQAAFKTPSGSASGSAAFVFGAGPTPPNPSLIDNCVSVTDTFKGTLGTTCASQSYSYARTVPVPTYDCVTYPNTATFTTNTTGTTGLASQSVKVCGPVKTGALTIGFWQNKNGQDIIKTGAATTGVCNSATWLRQYAPFQDLSATASCATTATYIFNVIKAASAAGTTMNPMLKAQMLATALDVYFSNPALGGNKISAPAPIGGVAIDLTKVCKDIAACSVYENVSAVFGGASSLTVSQMLSYAASQSNVGGSTWYANVKATQELAKDAFDAINNQVAFGA